MASGANDFLKKTKELEKMVGSGNLTGTFAVNGGERTVPLEVGGWRSGPLAGVEIENWSGGDNPHAIQKSFTETYQITLKDIAETTLESGPQEAMVRGMGRITKKFQEKAPEVTRSYKESYAEVVTDNGVPIHEEFGTHYGQEPSGS